MKAVLLLTVAYLSVAYGLFFFGSLTPGLRIRLATSLIFGVNSTHLYDIPRDLSDLVEQGWTKVSKPEDGYLQSLDMYCMRDNFDVCILFDDMGYVAGVQVSFAKKNFVTPLDMPGLGYKTWVAPANNREPAQERWYHQLYFVSEETLKKPVAQRAAMHQNGESNYERTVWITDDNGKLVAFPTNRKEFLANSYTEQGCIVAMGRHYYNNMTSSNDCEKLRPWAGLVYGDEVVGISHNLIAQYPEPEGVRDWFERPPYFISYLVTPNAPDCLYKQSRDVGLLTLHVYFVDDPLDMGVNCVLGSD